MGNSYSDTVGVQNKHPKIKWAAGSAWLKPTASPGKASPRSGREGYSRQGHTAHLCFRRRFPRPCSRILDEHCPPPAAAGRLPGRGPASCTELPHVPRARLGSSVRSRSPCFINPGVIRVVRTDGCISKRCSDALDWDTHFMQHPLTCGPHLTQTEETRVPLVKVRVLGWTEQNF